MAPEYCFLKHRPIFFAFFSIAHRSLGRQSPDSAHVAARRDCHLHPTRIEPQQYSQGSSGDIPFTSLHRTAESAPLSLPRSLLLDRSRACAPLPRGSSPPPRLRPPSSLPLSLSRSDGARSFPRHDSLTPSCRCTAAGTAWSWSHPRALALRAARTSSAPAKLAIYLHRAGQQASPSLPPPSHSLFL